MSIPNTRTTELWKYRNHPLLFTEFMKVSLISVWNRKKELPPSRFCSYEPDHSWIKIEFALYCLLWVRTVKPMLLWLLKVRSLHTFQGKIHWVSNEFHSQEWKKIWLSLVEIGLGLEGRISRVSIRESEFDLVSKRGQWRRHECYVFTFQCSSFF